MNKKNAKMNTKRILVSFLLIASVLFLISAVSALPIDPTFGDYHNIAIKVNGDSVTDDGLPPVTGEVLSTATAGDTITVKVSFKYDDISTTDETDSIRVKITLEGNNDDVVATTNSFNVEEGNTYSQTLTLKVPSDFESDSLTGDFPLTVKIGDEEIELGDLHIQRQSDDVAIKSVMTSTSVEAGQLVPVDVVLKNVGYNDLSDLYVTASIGDLKLSKTAYFGDLVTVDYTGDEEENTVSGKLYLEIPYNVKSGTYTLEITAENEETSITVTKEIVITNGFPDVAMKSGNDLVLLNPTNQLKVYTVKYADTEVSIIVPAASSKSVTIQTPTSGEYKFDVAVFSGDKLLSTINFSGVSSAPSLTSPVMVLTVILAIVFLVLLVVLVVLITKKPQKTEEFGESYY